MEEKKLYLIATKDWEGIKLLGVFDDINKFKGLNLNKHRIITFTLNEQTSEDDAQPFC